MFKWIILSIYMLGDFEQNWIPFPVKFINDRGLEDLGVSIQGGHLKLDLLQYILASWIYRYFPFISHGV